MIGELFERVQLVHADDLSPLRNMGEGIAPLDALPPVGDGYWLVPVVRAAALDDEWEPVKRELPVTGTTLVNQTKPPS